MTRGSELRFAGFSEEWEEKKIKNISTINSGKDYKHLQSGDIPVYGTGGLMTHINEYLSEKDSIGIGRKGTINRPYILNHPFWTVDTLFFTTPNIETNLYFLYGIYQNINWLKYDESSGLPSLSKKNIENLVVSVPNIKEQEKIGDLFIKIDQLIENQEKLLDQSIAFKKSMIQKMFPKKDSLVPEFRFDGFNDNWESFKIKELANIKTGESNTQDADENGQYPFYIRSENPQSSNKYLYDEEAVLTIGDGKIGKVFFYVNGKYDLHQRVYRIFNFSENLDGKYFYHYFSKFFLRRAISLSAKATVDSVRMEMISDMIIKMPSLEEQIKIRDFLDNLDEKIASEEKLLDAYKDMKKSLLQKMFV